MRVLNAALCILLSVASASAQVDDLVAHHRTLRALKISAGREDILHPLQIPPLDPCAPTPLMPPSMIHGNISADSCYDSVINSYEDVYSLNGVAGQTVHIDYSSSAYEVFLFMEGIDTTIVSSLVLGDSVSRQTIDYTFQSTRAYKLEVETFFGPGNMSAYTGPYTLTVTLGALPSCTDSSTTVCLNNGRFAVSAAWQASDGTSGNGQALRLTSDTGYFTFFNASNVEVVVKVLNGCGLNSKYWVFAGGLTNVNVVLTIRDTQTGAVWTRTNPLNTAFQPVQDTGALATCP